MVSTLLLTTVLASSSKDGAGDLTRRLFGGMFGGLFGESWRGGTRAFCRSDGELCPDGQTWIGRSGPNCQFDFSTCPTLRCTEEARLCPDGTSISRTGPSCEFDFSTCPTLPCTADVELCPDGVTNVFRDELNNCEWDWTVCRSDDPRNCCRGFTARCMSCLARQSEQEYCQLNSWTPGCPTTPAQPCCRANNAECLACHNNMSVHEYCEMHSNTQCVMPPCPWSQPVPGCPGNIRP